jgi:CheY-like chemotaxis protein
MQKTILIVDFEQESSEELRQTLQNEDFLVLTAADGQQALDLFERAKPDLVLTEALLPKLNGFELCKKIAGGELREVRPVIMYSAIYKGEKYQKEAVSGCGALEFLEKPIPKWQLLKAVRSAFKEVPQVKIDAATNHSSDGRVAAAVSGSIPSAHDTGDLLEVDLFDSPSQVSSGPAVESTAETVVLEAPIPDSKPLLIPSIDSLEIDAALDSVRMDLHQEVQQRDELLARQFEQELRLEGHSILEFEAAVGTGPASSTASDGDAESKEFELDELLPQMAPESPVSGPESASKSVETSTPNFAIKAASSRNWLPILVLLLLALLAGAYFWFWG